MHKDQRSVLARPPIQIHLQCKGKRANTKNFRETAGKYNKVRVVGLALAHWTYWKNKYERSRRADELQIHSDWTSLKICTPLLPRRFTDSSILQFRCCLIPRAKNGGGELIPLWEWVARRNFQGFRVLRKFEGWIYVCKNEDICALFLRGVIASLRTGNYARCLREDVRNGKQDILWETRRENN